MSRLREDLQAKLGDLYDNPIVHIMPTEIVGHRAYVFGQVAKQGFIVIDREVRILDLLSTSGGFDVRFDGMRPEQAADLARSFLIRDQKIIPVDFRALVNDGDLRYNIRVHPGDLLYVADLNQSRVSVFGAVRTPGPIRYSDNLTVIGALSRSGGLLERASREARRGSGRYQSTDRVRGR